MDEKLTSRLLAIMCLAVTSVWVISFLAPLVRTDFVPRPEVNVGLLAVLGIFVQLYRKSRRPVIEDENTKQGLPAEEEDA